MKKILAGAVTSVLILAAAIAPAFATTTTVIVTPGDTHGWLSADTREGGQINFIDDATSPYPSGALQLLTNNTNTAKAQYLKVVNTLLSDVSELSYHTKYVSGPTFAGPSFQVLVDLNGATEGGFTTLVYEPYWNGTVNTTGVWQNWNVNAPDAKLWSSRSFTDGSSCSVANGGGGPPFYSLDELKANCSGAVVGSVGINVGSYNPNFNVNTDGVIFNDTTYDFELTVPDVTPPSVPTNLHWVNRFTQTLACGSVITDLGAGGVKADWDDSTGEPNHYEYVSFNPADATHPVSGWPWPPTTLGYVVANSEYGDPGYAPSIGTYGFMVRAVDIANNKSDWTDTTQTIDDSCKITFVALTNKNQCKNGNWESFTVPTFKNQGDCVSYIQSNSNAEGNREDNPLN